jgi:hypothetical protein
MGGISKLGSESERGKNRTKLLVLVLVQLCGPSLLLAHLSLDLVFIFIFVILPIVHKIKGTTHTFIITFHSLPILWQFNFNACIALFYLNIIFYIVSLRKFDFDFLLVSTFLFYIYTRDLSLFIIVSTKIVYIYMSCPLIYIRVCIFHVIVEINFSNRIWS